MSTDFISGRIKKIYRAKGFGFIRLDPDADGTKKPDVFFHAEECGNRFEQWTPGCLVQFLLVETKEGKLRATSVTLVQSL